MSAVTTTRPVDLAALDAALGGAGLSMTDDGTTRTITVHDSTTKAQLQAAINAHVPVFPPDRGAVDAATAAVAQMVVQSRVEAGTLTYTEATTVAAAFPVWSPNEDVTLGDLRYFDGHLVEVIQAHTTQPDWTPDAVPALWKTWRDAEAVEPWAQPIGSEDAYPLGAKVTHNGDTWTSTVANNSWEPGVYGWTEVAA